jgi:hypothetical protein
MRYFIEPRKEISEVFTPRRSEVNADMYVQRPLHEKSLMRALQRDSHALIFGESGKGFHRKIGGGILPRCPGPLFLSVTVPKTDPSG